MAVRTRVSAALIISALLVLVGSAFALRDSGDNSTSMSTSPAEKNKADRAKNERILESLVPPAGARIVLKRSRPAYESTSDVTERKIGYVTDLEYNVPKGVSSPRWVADWYTRQLDGWKSHVQVIPCEETFAGEIPTPCKDLVIAEFAKGDARVSLNIDGFEGPRPWGYELSIMQLER